MNLDSLPDLIRERVVDCIADAGGCDIRGDRLFLCNYHDGMLVGWDMRGDHDG